MGLFDDTGFDVSAYEKAYKAMADIQHSEPTWASTRISDSMDSEVFSSAGVPNYSMLYRLMGFSQYCPYHDIIPFPHNYTCRYTGTHCSLAVNEECPVLSSCDRMKEHEKAHKNNQCRNDVDES